MPLHPSAIGVIDAANGASFESSDINSCSL
jgi:hypothetical protein